MLVACVRGPEKTTGGQGLQPSADPSGIPGKRLQVVKHACISSFQPRVEQANKRLLVLHRVHNTLCLDGGKGQLSANVKVTELAFKVSHPN